MSKAWELPHGEGARREFIRGKKGEGAARIFPRSLDSPQSCGKEEACPQVQGLIPEKNRSCWYRLSMGKEDFLMGHGP